MKIPIRYTFLLFVGFSLMAGCGAQDSSNPNLDGDAAGVTISMQASQGPSLTGGSLMKALETSDQGGSIFNIESAWVNLDDIQIEIPGNCEDITVDLPSIVSCEAEDGDSSDDSVDESSEDSSDDGETSLEDPETAFSSLEDNDGGETEIKIHGPFIVDLVNGTTIPEIGILELPSGIVHEVKVKVDVLEEGSELPPGVPEELLGHSLLVTGTVSLNEGETPFQLRLKFDEEIEFENLEGVEISEAVDVNEILLNFDVDQWLAGIDLQACVDQEEIAEVEGTLLIENDSTSGECSDIEDIIKDNVEKSGSLEEDHDDGEDSSDEADSSEGEVEESS